MGEETLIRLAGHLGYDIGSIRSRDRSEPLATCRKVLMSYMSQFHHIFDLAKLFERTRGNINIHKNCHADNYECDLIYKECYDILLENELPNKNYCKEDDEIDTGEVEELALRILKFLISRKK
tara:strand:+ start:3113 stop:3481 length:369 start_codon:yes stop_codon:yes gene_type:complete